MKILLWVLGGVWFISAVLFVLALAGAAAKRIATTVKVANPGSNRKRHLAKAQSPATISSSDRPFLVTAAEQ